MHLETKTIRPGEFLIKEGEKSTELYAVLSGNFEIVKGEGDNEKVIGEIEAGELAGEMSFLDKEPRCASVRATQESEVSIIPRDLYQDIFESQPDWYKNITKTLLKRLRDANKKFWV